MNYACLTHQTFSHFPYEILPLRQEDIFLIKEWRNEQMEILRQDIVLTDDMQKNYYDQIISPSFALKEPKQILFSLLKNNALIGYGGIVHINWEKKEGEVSFLVDNQRAKEAKTYQADFTSYLNLIKKVAFQDLPLKRLFTETFDVRPQHIKILESEGFVLEKRLKGHVMINGQLTDALIHGCKK